jgi:hypothetical protein
MMARILFSSCRLRPAFINPPPCDTRARRQTFGDELGFDAPMRCLEFPRTRLDTPITAGARQGSCRLIHAASSCLSFAVECAAPIEC